MARRAADDVELPRLQAHDVPPTLPPSPELHGEHGQLGAWFARALGVVQDEIKDVRDRLARMEGAEEARAEWRQGIDSKLDTLLARHGEANGQRGWLTERTVPLMLGAGLMVCVLVLVFAILFGPASTGKAIRDIRHEAGQAL